MSKLGERVESMLVGDARPPASFRDLLLAVERNAGSGRKAAAAVGVPETTWRRWKAGAKPKGGRGSLVGREFRRQALSPTRPTDGTLTLKVTQQGRERTLKPSSLDLAPGTMDRVAATFIATGDRERAAAALVGGVNRGDTRGFYAKSLRMGMGDDYPEDNDALYEDVVYDVGDDTLPGMVAV